MKQFIITLAAVIVGGIVLLILPFFFFCLIAIAAAGGTDSQPANPGTILEMNLSMGIIERSTTTTARSFATNIWEGNSEPMTLEVIREGLKSAAKDPNISALFLTGDNVDADFPVLNETRRLIQRFKQESEKPIYYYSTNASRNSLYLASVADSIFIAPEGSASMTGISTMKMYYLRLAEKLGIGFDVIKHGKYKSAVEPHFRYDMSPEDREQTQHFVDVIWSVLRDSIANSRGIESSVIDEYIDEMAYLGTADKAVEIGLVDRLIYRDQMISQMKKLTNKSAEEDLECLSICEYNTDTKKKTSKDKVAIVYASGIINDGSDDNDPKNIYGDDLAATLREIRNDKEIKAVVMRVNSPGGSALASDIIWREVLLLNESKPVVVSMGQYAASGGYYISCAAKEIITDPTTLTGSIGVYGSVPNAEKMIQNAGVGFETVSSSKSPFVAGIRSLHPDQVKKLTENVEHVYKVFVGNVSKGRNMPFERVDELGLGRVWTGVDAVENGLADKLGYLEDAINHAAQFAGLEDYSTTEYPKGEDSVIAIMKALGLNAKATLGEMIFGSYYKDLCRIQETIENPQIKIETICDLEIR